MRKILVYIKRCNISMTVPRIIDETRSARVPPAHRPVLPPDTDHEQSEGRRAEHIRGAHC